MVASQHASAHHDTISPQVLGLPPSAASSGRDAPSSFIGGSDARGGSSSAPPSSSSHLPKKDIDPEVIEAVSGATKAAVDGMAKIADATANSWNAMFGAKNTAAKATPPSAPAAPKKNLVQDAKKAALAALS